MKKLLLVLVLMGMLVVGSSAIANAVTISVYGALSPITSFSWSQSGNTINISETWTGGGWGFLKIDGLTPLVNYTVNKTVINMTGANWLDFSNELLDKSGGNYTEPNNDNLDNTPYPSWVPTGYTTSNETDGLSFAQYANPKIPRTSIKFSGLIIDELHYRDFLDFNEGLVYGNGDTDTMSFGLVDKSPTDNSPFLLAQRANKYSIPEPASMSLLGLGLLGAIGAGIRSRKNK